MAVGEPADGAQLVDVVSIDANNDGTVMALTEEALLRVDVDPPPAVALPAAAPPGAAAVTAGPSGTAWVMSGLSGGGALHFDGEQWLGLPVDEDLQFGQNPEPPWPVAGDADENGILWSTAVVELGGWVLGPTGLVAFAPDFSWSLIDRPDGIGACKGCWYDLAPDGRVWTFTESGMSRYDPTSGWTDFPFEQGSRTVLFDADNGPTPWVSSYDWSSGERITWVMDAAHPTFAPHWLRLNSSRGLATAVEGWPMDASSAPIDRACLEAEFGSAVDAFDLDEILASPEQTIQLAGNVARGLETAPDGTAYAAFTCVGITHLLADGTADVMPASELPSLHLADLTVGPDGRVWVAGDFGVTTLG